MARFCLLCSLSLECSLYSYISYMENTEGGGVHMCAFVDGREPMTLLRRRMIVSGTWPSGVIGNVGFHRDATDRGAGVIGGLTAGTGR